ncbi:MAG: hypothetical protein ACKODX_08515, partial [Gemmata sp.]
PARAQLRRDSPTRPRGRSYELLIGLGLAALCAAAYLLYSRRGVPGASSAIGYTLGALGFALMVATETLYTARKRVKNFHRGKMSVWLKVHIVTGLVGPCLVLLHSGGQFHGLAGVLAGLTCVIVASGFVGRYIYTAVPRTIDGAEVAVRELEDRIAEADAALRDEGLGYSKADGLVAATQPTGRRWVLVFGRWFARRAHQRKVRRALAALGRPRAERRRLEGVLLKRYDVQVQIASLAAARRLLAVWHILHIPLGAAMFTLALVHIAGAMYYAALSK